MANKAGASAIPRLAAAFVLAFAGAGGAARAEGEAVLRVTVDAPGVYEVGPAAVKEAGLELAACDLFEAAGRAVPIVERPDGGFQFWGDPGAARHSRERSYVLWPRPPGAAKARASEPEPPATFLVEKNAWYDPVEVKERALVAPFDGSEIDYFYFGKPAAVQEYAIELLPLAVEGATAEVSFVFQGERRAAASNGLDIEWDGTKVGPTIRWSGGKPCTEKVALAKKLLAPGKHEVKLLVRDGKVRLDRIAIAAAPRTSGPRRKPLRVEVARPEDLLRGGADWLAIALDSLRPALAPLAEHRAKRGLKTRIVRLEDVFDTFTGGTFDPAAIRAFLAHAAAHWDPKPRYVLLAGDATYDVDWYRPRGETMPTALVDTVENGASASDDWFVAWGDDRAIPKVAIGRFPARTAEECRSMVERTVRYETEADHGPWRRKLSFVAGEGRFGEAIDRAIEELAVRIFNEYVPYGFDLNMTYASAGSPYLWVPDKLTDKVIERMNEGCALLSYTGHGHMDGFDALRWRGKRYPIFARTDVAKVKCGTRPPMVFITACWTGCYDSPDEEAIGELLFEHPQGPVAVFAATRVSHPFSNAFLSKEAVAGLFGGRSGVPAATLGDAIVETKRLLVEGKDEYRDMINGYGLMFLQDPILMQRLLADNMHLYNLLGDPALVPALPRGKVAFECGPAVPGKKVKVAGRTDAVSTGKAIVTFEIARAKIRGEIAPVDLSKKDSERRIAKNYETANDKVVTRAETDVKEGAFEVELALPDDLLPYKHYVKAYVWNEQAEATGSHEVTLDFGTGDEN